MCNVGCTFDSRSGIRNQCCCPFIRTQDSQWFKSCLSTTLAVCQVISQALSLEFRDTHPFIPPALHTSPSIQPSALSLLSLLCPLSLFFTSIFAHLNLSQLQPHILLYLSSFIFTHIWTTICLFSFLSVFFQAFPAKNVLTAVIWTGVNLFFPFSYHSIKILK